MLKKFLFISLCLLSAGAKMYAQSPRDFLQLPADSQKHYVRIWLNTSEQSHIPGDFIQEAIHYYTQKGIDERVAIKNISQLKPIFNSDLSVYKRLSYIAYLQANSSPDELPMMLLAELEQVLSNRPNPKR
jgi:hypothetical protein